MKLAIAFIHLPARSLPIISQSSSYLHFLDCLHSAVRDTVSENIALLSKFSRHILVLLLQMLSSRLSGNTRYTSCIILHVADYSEIIPRWSCNGKTYLDALRFIYAHAFRVTIIPFLFYTVYPSKRVRSGKGGGVPDTILHTRLLMYSKTYYSITATGTDEHRHPCMRYSSYWDLFFFFFYQFFCQHFAPGYSKKPRSPRKLARGKCNAIVCCYFHPTIFRDENEQWLSFYFF